MLDDVNLCIFTSLSITTATQMEIITVHKKFTSQEQANAHVASVCENAQKTDIGSGEYLFENNRVSGWLFFNHNEKNEKVWNVKYSNF